MDILIWIIAGAVVGWVASLVMGSSGGILTDIIVGIVGAVIGGYVMNFFGQAGVGGFNLYSFLVALLGACALIGVVRAVR